MKQFKPGDEVWFDYYYPWYTDFTLLIKGNIEHICAAGSKRCLISFHRSTKSSTKEIIIIDDDLLFTSKKDGLKFFKKKSPVSLGDLVSYIEHNPTKGLGAYDSIAVGTCVKLTNKYAHIQSETKIKKVAKQDCIVISRSKESS